MTDSQHELIARDPVALTQREMLLRLDARFDRFEARTRALEDEQLIARTERKTVMALVSGLRSTVLVAATLGPVLAGIVIAFANASSGH